MQAMTPQEFLEQIRLAYHNAMVPTKPAEGIFRHRVRSTSGAQEDLVAYFIRSQDKSLQVHIDQPITIRPPENSPKTIDAQGIERSARAKTWYPDIVVVHRRKPSDSELGCDTIIALVDVKTDLGWGREDESFEKVCSNLCSIRSGILDGRHRPLVKPLSRRRRMPGSDGAKQLPAPHFDVARLHCAESMTCHVVVVTAANSGDIAETESSRQTIARKLGVHLHVLMDSHPNKSKREIAKSANTSEGTLTAIEDLVLESLRLDDFDSLTSTISRAIGGADPAPITELSN